MRALHRTLLITALVGATGAGAWANPTRSPELPVSPYTPPAYQIHLDARRAERFSADALTRIAPSRLEQMVADAFETLDGTQGLVLRLPRRHPLPSPAVAGPRLFVSGGYGSYEFYALDAKSLKPTWGVSFDAQGPARAVPVDDKLVVSTASGLLLVLHQRDGRRVWQRYVGEVSNLSPAVGKGMVITAYPYGHGHRLAAYRLSDGQPLFERQLGAPPITTPVIHGDSVFVSTFDGTVHRFLLAGGHRVWAKPVGAISAPEADGATLYVTTAGPGQRTLALTALATADGSAKRLWAVPAGGKVPYLEANNQATKHHEEAGRSLDADVGQYPTTPAAQTALVQHRTGGGAMRAVWEYESPRPVVRGGVAYVSHHNQLTAIDLKKGTTLWTHGPVRASQGGFFFSRPEVTATQIVVAAANGELTALDRATGNVSWSWQTGYELRTPPVVAGGRLTTATTTGEVLSFSLTR